MFFHIRCHDPLRHPRNDSLHSKVKTPEVIDIIEKKENESDESSNLLFVAAICH